MPPLLEASGSLSVKGPLRLPLTSALSPPAAQARSPWAVPCVPTSLGPAPRHRRESARGTERAAPQLVRGGLLPLEPLNLACPCHCPKAASGPQGWLRICWVKGPPWRPRPGVPLPLPCSPKTGCVPGPAACAALLCMWGLCPVDWTGCVVPVGGDIPELGPQGAVWGLFPPFGASHVLSSHCCASSSRRALSH